MATFDYTRFTDLMATMAAKYGHQSVSFVSVGTPGEYDPSSREVTNSEVTSLIDAIVSPTQTHTDRKSQDQTFSKTGYTTSGLQVKKVRFMMIAGDALASAPVAGDRVTLDSDTWLVDGVTPINPGGVTVAYKIGLVL